MDYEGLDKAYPAAPGMARHFFRAVRGGNEASFEGGGSEIDALLQPPRGSLCAPC